MLELKGDICAESTGTAQRCLHGQRKGCARDGGTTPTWCTLQLAAVHTNTTSACQHVYTAQASNLSLQKAFQTHTHTSCLAFTRANAGSDLDSRRVLLPLLLCLQPVPSPHQPVAAAGCLGQAVISHECVNTRQRQCQGLNTLSSSHAATSGTHTQ